MIKILHDQQRKTRGLRRLTKKMEVLVESNDFTKLSKRNQNKLIRKVQSGIDQLKPFFTIRTVRKTVTAAIAVVGILMGIAKTGMAQNFGPVQVNSFGLDTTNYAFIPAVADLDGDGDFDLLVGEYVYGQTSDNILFFENIGTVDSAWFTAPVRSPFGLGDNTDTKPIIDLVDIDDDGDLDCFISAFYNTGSLCYYENIGTETVPNFGPKQSKPFGIELANAEGVKFVDIDGDGDYDLTANSDSYVSTNGSKAILLYTNNGTVSNPEFDADSSILLNINTPFSAYGSFFWVDIDHDGDYDLFEGGQTYIYSSVYKGLAYYENIGDSVNPAFALADAFPFGLNAWIPSVYANLYPAFADMDNDGDYDALIGAWISDSIAILHYFEDTTDNSGINSIGNSLKSNNDSFIIDVYPNPARHELNIKISEGISIDAMCLTNVLGKELYRNNDLIDNHFAIRLDDYTEGVYFLSLQTKAGTIVKKIYVSR